MYGLPQAAKSRDHASSCGLQGSPNEVRGLSRRRSREAIRQGGCHSLCRLPQHRALEALAVRSRKANPIPAARSTPERALRRLPQTHPVNCGQERSLLQAHPKRLRGLPRPDQSCAALEAHRLVSEVPLHVHDCPDMSFRVTRRLQCTSEYAQRKKLRSCLQKLHVL